MVGICLPLALHLFYGRAVHGIFAHLGVGLPQRLRPLGLRHLGREAAYQRCPHGRITLCKMANCMDQRTNAAKPENEPAQNSQQPPSCVIPKRNQSVCPSRTGMLYLLLCFALCLQLPHLIRIASSLFAGVEYMYSYRYRGAAYRNTYVCIGNQRNKQ